MAPGAKQHVKIVSTMRSVVEHQLAGRKKVCKGKTGRLKKGTENEERK
jgi:hypothetical protein